MKFSVCTAIVVASFVFNCMGPVYAQLLPGDGGLPVLGNQVIRVPADSPLVALGLPPGDLDLTFPGSFTVAWEAENESGVANLANFVAEFQSELPGFGPFQINAIGAGPMASFDGTLSNILSQDGQLVEASLSVSTTFSLTLEANGLTLYTKDHALFSGPLVMGPAAIGDVFQDPDSPNDIVQVFAMLPNPEHPDTLVEVPVAHSLNRTVTVVPEPNLSLTAILVFMLPCFRRQRYLVRG